RHLTIKRLLDTFVSHTCFNRSFEIHRMTIRDEPRDRLLNAAGEVFAEKGFKGGTVRAICLLANVNVAAVNYYFRDKERLYIEAVKQAACGLPEAQARPWPAHT